MKLKNESSSVGAEYAAPTGLGIISVFVSTEMPRLRRWNSRDAARGSVIHAMRGAVLDCASPLALCRVNWGAPMSPRQANVIKREKTL
jgi:hypothetical protein